MQYLRAGELIDAALIPASLPLARWVSMCNCWAKGTFWSKWLPPVQQGQVDHGFRRQAVLWCLDCMRDFQQVGQLPYWEESMAPLKDSAPFDLRGHHSP